MLNRRTLGVLCLLAISSVLLAQNEQIKIKTSKRVWTTSADAVLLFADLGNEAVALRCELSHGNCQVLAPGHYEIARLIPGEGSYKACASNVDIYRIGADRLKEKPLAEYCLEYPQS